PSVGNSVYLTGLPDGSLGSLVRCEGDRTAGSDPGAGILVRTAPRGLPLSRDDLTTRATTVSGSGTRASTGSSSAGELFLQACADSGCGLSVTAEKQTPATPPADCPGHGGTFSIHQRDPARTVSASLYRGRAHRAGYSLLAAGRPKSHAAFG